MAYAIGTIQFQVYVDTADTVFPQLSLPNLSATFKDTAVTGVQPLYLSLAGAGSQTVNLNGIGNPSKMYFYSDSQDVNVNINGLGNILFKAQVPGLVPCSISSLVLTNASASVSTNVTLVLVTG